MISETYALILITLHQVTHLGTIDIWEQLIFCCEGAVPCIVGYSGVSLASTHEVSGSPPPSCDDRKAPDVNRCHPDVKSSRLRNSSLHRSCPSVSADHRRLKVVKGEGRLMGRRMSRDMAYNQNQVSFFNTFHT